MSDLYTIGRVTAAAEAARAAGPDALFLTRGPDLRYLIGYDATPFERLTCLVVPADGLPFLALPRFERATAQASPAANLGLEFVGWGENEDPFGIIASRTGAIGSVGLSDRMWASNVFNFRRVLPGTRQELAGKALRGLRMRKSAAEVAALRAAGGAIDGSSSRPARCFSQDLPNGQWPLGSRKRCSPRGMPTWTSRS